MEIQLQETIFPVLPEIKILYEPRGFEDFILKMEAIYSSETSVLA
jgi:hypothetical protein